MCVNVLPVDVANMNTNNIKIIAKKVILNLTNSRIRLYPVEGPMLKAPMAPFTLVIIVRCLTLRTTIDAGRCTQCRPSNVHQEEDDPKRKTETMSVATRKKTKTIQRSEQS
jgi:hypothetical protein